MMTTKITPLLASEDEGDNGIPALGVSHLDSREDFQSPLEALIAHSTSEQRGDTLVGADDNPVPCTRNDRIDDLPDQIEPSSYMKRSSLVTLAACSCCLLQIGLVWGSFLSPSWLDTRLYFSIVLPSVHIETNNSQLLHLTTLSSLFGDLVAADRHWAAIGLVLSALILPCLCAISSVIWITEDRRKQNKIKANGLSRLMRYPNTQWNYTFPRLCLEYSARIGLSVFFIISILAMGTSPLEIEYNGATFIIANQMKGGMALYMMGTTFGLIVLALLRFEWTNLQGAYLSFGVSNGSSGRESSEIQDNECSWEVSSNELFTGIAHRRSNRTGANAKERELERPLLQNGDNKNTLVTPERRDSNFDEIIQTERGVLSFWRRALIYELALISTVLWIPAAFLPLFHLKYEGVVSDFVSEVELSFRLYDIPKELWKRGISSHVDPCIMGMFWCIYLSLVIIFPVVANLAAIGTWKFDNQSGKYCRNILWVLQPFLGTIVFSVALYFTIPAFETVTEIAIEKFSPGICEDFNGFDPCFSIDAEPKMGLWFLLAEGLSLELFVVLTLAWRN